MAFLVVTISAAALYDMASSIQTGGIIFFFVTLPLVIYYCILVFSPEAAQCPKILFQAYATLYLVFLLVLGYYIFFQI